VEEADRGVGGSRGLEEPLAPHWRGADSRSIEAGSTITAASQPTNRDALRSKSVTIRAT